MYILRAWAGLWYVCVKFFAEVVTMTERDLVGRLEKLERDNRRLKRLGAAALVLAAALGAIYATRPVPAKITAHEFDLVDRSGATRGFMGVRDGASNITLSDSQGKPGVVMAALSSGASGISLSDSQGKAGVAMTVSPSGEPSVGLSDSQGNPRVFMVVLPSGEPDITLQDAQGFSMDLGSTNTVTLTTGQTQKTSAASIVMFGNDKKHHVIWQAP